MNDELMVDWLTEVRKRRQGTPLNKRGRNILGVFKDHFAGKLKTLKFLIQTQI
jgi:hypothetical protein